ncbi:unnamed protein product [Rhizoctonia solani]|uniref:Transmembrane protein n=1 Tax=Rhizoctonia solani TaxID=456999 RepID=A0A8H3CP12_9AGAM|nr:unnamed protein product [Rhizoctonia solani]
MPYPSIQGSSTSAIQTSSGSHWQATLKYQGVFKEIEVRVSLYAQVLLLWLWFTIHPDKLGCMTESAIFSAELMLVKSLDSLRTQQFGLLDGLVVSFVTTMVLSFCIATHPRLIWDDPHVATARIATRIFALFLRLQFIGVWGGWCFLMWHDPVQFALKGDAAITGCIPNLEVILTIPLSKRMHAVSAGARVLALSLVLTLLFIALCSWLLHVNHLFPFRPVSNLPALGLRVGETWSHLGSPPSDLAAAVRLLTTRLASSRNTVYSIIKRLPQLTAIATVILLIYMTEQTICQSDTNNNAVWGWYGVAQLGLLLFLIVHLATSTWRRAGGQNTEIVLAEWWVRSTEERARHARVDPEVYLTEIIGFPRHEDRLSPAWLSQPRSTSIS